MKNRILFYAIFFFFGSLCAVAYSVVRADPLNLWVDSGTAVYYPLGNVAIGPAVTAPASLLQISKNALATAPVMSNTLLGVIAADGQANNFEMDSYGASDRWIARRAEGTAAAPTAVASNNAILQMGVRGYNGSAFGAGNAAQITMSAAETWTTTANGTKMAFQTTPIGSVTAATVLTITDSGRVGIGTTSPAYALDVKGAIRQDVANCPVLGADASGQIVCAVAGTFAAVPSLQTVDNPSLDFVLGAILFWIPVFFFVWVWKRK